MKVLITGINGFVGSWLAEYCLKVGCDVIGLVRHRSNLENIESIKNRLCLFEGDITDSYSITSVMDKVKPDKVFHLAAQSFVPYSWIAPEETMRVNVQGTVNVLEAVRKCSPNAIVQLAGTSEEYGKVEEDEVPVKEANQLRPLSPYAVSKVATDLLGWQYFQSYGLKVIRTRAFNHTGPRRGKEFVVSQFVKQVVDVKKGIKSCVNVGNLKAIRDFTDVRDIVEAYWLATELCEYGKVYNICSGIGRSMEEVLDLVIMEVFLDSSVKKQIIEYDWDRLRPSDVSVLIGDCSKFRNKTGWLSKIKFESTLRDMISYIGDFNG